MHDPSESPSYAYIWACTFVHQFITGKLGNDRQYTTQSDVIAVKRTNICDKRGGVEPPNGKDIFDTNIPQSKGGFCPWPNVDKIKIANKNLIYSYSEQDSAEIDANFSRISTGLMGEGGKNRALRLGHFFNE